MTRRVLCLALLILASPLQAAVILLYHHVDEKTPAATSVTPDQFAEHLQRLEDEAFEVVRLDELMARIKAGVNPRERIASITFDDAYESILRTALPMLEERGWQATVFVATEPVLERSRGMLKPEQITEIHQRGHLIANHSHSHPHMVRRLDGETRKQWLDRLKGEIHQAQTLLKDWIGESPPTYFAYPYGEQDAFVRAFLAEMGYLGFAQRSGAIDKLMDPHDIPRIPVNRQFAAWSGLGDKVRALPMPVIGSQPEDGVTDEIRPLFSLLLPEGWRQKGINCFVRGQPAKLEWKSGEQGDRLQVAPSQDLVPGRHLVNCTAQAGEGRFYWYSWLWMHRQDGWYLED